MNGIQVEVRFRVSGLRELDEVQLAELLDAAADVVERRVPEIGPVASIHGDELCALGTFDFTREWIAHSDRYLHELAGAVRSVLEQQSVIQVTTMARELVAA